MLHIQKSNRYPTFALITIGLVMLNTLVFIANYPTGAVEGMAYKIGFVPAEGFSLIKVFSSIFVHGNWKVLLINIIFLWFFGHKVEEEIGNVRYILLYLLLGGIVMGIHYLSDIHDSVPVGGAGGVISGILGAYLYLFPNAKMEMLWGSNTITISARVYILIWFFDQFANSLTTSEYRELLYIPVGEVCFWSHIGSFIMGWLLTKSFSASKIPTSHAQAAD